jgi:hypothetical protein
MYGLSRFGRVRRLWPEEKPDLWSLAARRGKSDETAAKLHGGTLDARMQGRSAERRMSLSRLNFKIGSGAGKRIAWVCCERSKAIMGSGSRGASGRETGRKGEDQI